MKKINPFLILLFLISFLTVSDYSQDTAIIKYLPLKVGNLWVYNWNTVVPPTTGKTKIVITSTILQNGHLFYVFQQSGSTCNCGLSTASPFINTSGPIRVDSVTCNILVPGGSGLCGLNNELLLDSLKKKIGDPILYPCSVTACVDTSTVNILGVNRKTKSFTDNIMTYFTSRYYAKDIGLYKSYKGCMFNYYCTYNIQGCVINGVVYGDTSFPAVGINLISSEIPGDFSLSQNYPNPFNPTTKIRFEIPAAGAQYIEPVQLKIYDVLGREVATLVNEKLSAGTFEVEWDAGNLPSGVYYYTLRAGNYTETKKMVLLK